MSIPEISAASNVVPRFIQYGFVRYRAFTVEELGVVPNPHMWIGSGQIFCVGCQAARLHDAYSHPGLGDCFAVCRKCERYYRAEHAR